ALVSVQNEFSPVVQGVQDEVALCEELGIAYLAWGPLGGMRSAKGLGSTALRFAEIAARHGVSPQRIALAWELAASPVVIPIPGASRVESVLDSAEAVDLVLSEDEVAFLGGES
ncbi:MAG TPA: aldo/keto reductase, partial [Marmoricola sp.]|nr:aldo/keto reductase [Marmoricola sp.]